MDTPVRSYSTRRRRAVTVATGAGIFLVVFGMVAYACTLSHVGDFWFCETEDTTAGTHRCDKPTAPYDDPNNVDPSQDFSGATGSTFFANMDGTETNADFRLQYIEGDLYVSENVPVTNTGASTCNESPFHFEDPSGNPAHVTTNAAGDLDDFEVKFPPTGTYVACAVRINADTGAPLDTLNAPRHVAFTTP